MCWNIYLYIIYIYICVIHNVAIVLHIYIHICINQFITPTEDLEVWSTCIYVRHCSTITQNQEENLNLKSATLIPNQKERTSPTTNQPLWLYIHIPKLQSANRNPHQAEAAKSFAMSREVASTVAISLSCMWPAFFHTTMKLDILFISIHWMPGSFITQGGCTHLSILALHRSPFWL